MPSLTLAMAFIFQTVKMKRNRSKPSLHLFFKSLPNAFSYILLAKLQLYGYVELQGTLHCKICLFLCVLIQAHCFLQLNQSFVSMPREQILGDNYQLYTIPCVMTKITAILVMFSNYIFFSHIFSFKVHEYFSVLDDTVVNVYKHRKFKLTEP